MNSAVHPYFDSTNTTDCLTLIKSYTIYFIQLDISNDICDRITYYVFSNKTKKNSKKFKSYITLAISSISFVRVNIGQKRKQFYKKTIFCWVSDNLLMP